MDRAPEARGNVWRAQGRLHTGPQKLRALRPPQARHRTLPWVGAVLPAGPDPHPCDGVLGGGQDKGMRGEGPSRQAWGCDPHHPGPSGRVPGAGRTAVPQLAAPRRRAVRLSSCHRWPLRSLPSPSRGPWALCPAWGWCSWWHVRVNCDLVLTWGTSETRPRRLSSICGTASVLGPVCSCTRWLVTKAQMTPILRTQGRRKGLTGCPWVPRPCSPVPLTQAPLTAARGWSATGRS